MFQVAKPVFFFVLPGFYASSAGSSSGGLGGSRFSSSCACASAQNASGCACKRTRVRAHLLLHLDLHLAVRVARDREDIPAP